MSADFCSREMREVGVSSPHGGHLRGCPGQVQGVAVGNYRLDGAERSPPCTSSEILRNQLSENMNTLAVSSLRCSPPLLVMFNKHYAACKQSAKL